MIAGFVRMHGNGWMPKPPQEQYAWGFLNRRLMGASRRLANNFLNELPQHYTEQVSFPPKFDQSRNRIPPQLLHQDAANQFTVERYTGWDATLKRFIYADDLVNSGEKPAGWTGYINPLEDEILPEYEKAGLRELFDASDATKTDFLWGTPDMPFRYMDAPWWGWGMSAADRIPTEKRLMVEDHLFGKITDNDINQYVYDVLNAGVKGLPYVNEVNSDMPFITPLYRALVYSGWPGLNGMGRYYGTWPDKIDLDGVTEAYWFEGDYPDYPGAHAPKYWYRDGGEYNTYRCFGTNWRNETENWVRERIGWEVGACTQIGRYAAASGLIDADDLLDKYSWASMSKTIPGYHRYFYGYAPNGADFLKWAQEGRNLSYRFYNSPQLVYDGIYEYDRSNKNFMNFVPGSDYATGIPRVNHVPKIYGTPTQVLEQDIIEDSPTSCLVTYHVSDTCKEYFTTNLNKRSFQLRVTASSARTVPFEYEEAIDYMQARHPVSNKYEKDTWHAKVLSMYERNRSEGFDENNLDTSGNGEVWVWTFNEWDNSRLRRPLGFTQNSQRYANFRWNGFGARDRGTYDIPRSREHLLFAGNQSGAPLIWLADGLFARHKNINSYRNTVSVDALGTVTAYGNDLRDDNLRNLIWREDGDARDYQRLPYWHRVAGKSGFKFSYVNDDMAELSNWHEGEYPWEYTGNTGADAIRRGLIHKYDVGSLAQGLYHDTGRVRFGARYTIPTRDNNGNPTTMTMVPDFR